MSTKSLISVAALIVLLPILGFLFAIRYGSVDDTTRSSTGRMREGLPAELRPDNLDEVQPLTGRGPHGEVPASLSDVVALLTQNDIENVRRGGYRVVICMQDIENDWSRLQVKGARTILEQYRVNIIAVTDGEFDLEKQLADYRNAIALKPDIIITIPLHTEKCAPTLRQAVGAGIKLVFMDTVPTGFVHPRDYAGVVIADSYANGRVAAEIIAKHLNRKGKIAMLHWKNKMFTCDERTRAARETFAKFPDITVAAEEFFGGVYDVPELTRRILNQHPDLKGLWVVWDTPALEAVRVIKDMGKNVIVATVDLGHDLARAIATRAVVAGTGAQHPYDQGVAEAMIAVAALAGKIPPAYVAIPGEKVTRETLARAWRRVFHSEMPREIRELID